MSEPISIGLGRLVSAVMSCDVFGTRSGDVGRERAHWDPAHGAPEEYRRRIRPRLVLEQDLRVDRRGPVAHDPDRLTNGRVHERTHVGVPDGAPGGGNGEHALIGRPGAAVEAEAADDTALGPPGEVDRQVPVAGAGGRREGERFHSWPTIEERLEDRRDPIGVQPGRPGRCGPEEGLDLQRIGGGPIGQGLGRALSFHVPDGPHDVLERHRIDLDDPVEIGQTGRFGRLEQGSRRPPPVHRDLRLDQLARCGRDRLECEGAVACDQDADRRGRAAAGPWDAQRRDGDEVPMLSSEHRGREPQRVPESDREVEPEGECVDGVPIAGRDGPEQSVAPRVFQRPKSDVEPSRHRLHVGDRVLQGVDVHVPRGGGGGDPDVGPPERPSDPDHLCPGLGRRPGGVGDGRGRVDVVARDGQEPGDAHRGVPHRPQGGIRRPAGGGEVWSRRPRVPGDDRFDRDRELRPCGRETADEAPSRPDAVKDEEGGERGEARQGAECNPSPAGPWSPGAGRGGLRGHRRRPYRR